MQELKGNIRVFCRVRPIFADGNESDGSAVSFPTSTDLVGRGIDLANQSMKRICICFLVFLVLFFHFLTIVFCVITAQKYSFTFDRVFGPDSSQQDVFVEISQLVQSALDGYKVRLFLF